MPDEQRKGDNMKLPVGTRVSTKYHGNGEIVKHEIWKEKLSRYAIKFDEPVPWKDNVGYFTAREVNVETLG